MTLSRNGRTVLAGGVATSGAGLLFGNWPLFGAGALLLILVAFTGLARPPAVTRTIDRERIERGGRVVVTIDVVAPRGLGVVEIHQALPDEFELVSGNNFHLLTLGVRPKRAQYSFTLRAPKRGEWVLPPVGLKVAHPLGLAVSPPTSGAEPITLHVEPRAIAARIPRDLRTRAKRPFPDGDLARMGTATTEFRELREYVPGDPPRRINWKATARRMGAGASETPLVNETEFEGKKSVWIIVDGHARLSVGTNVEDARESAADAALSLVEQYLRRGYQVGMALARSGDVPPLRPGTGEAQVRRAREMLARLRAAEGPSILDVLDRDRVHLHRGRPLVVLVTRLMGDDPDLHAGVVRLGALARASGRNIVPGIVVDLEPTPARSDDPVDALALRAVDAGRLHMAAATRAAGLRVTQWRLGREPLEAVLVRGRLS